jgi:glycosyltransferase involved in cell wall biosynthesis
MIDAAFEGRRAMYELPARADVPRVLTVLANSMNFQGPTMSTLRYARAMDRARLLMDFVAIAAPPEELRREVTAMGARIHVLKGRTKNPVGYVLRLARIVRRGRYGIVHAHGNSCTLALEMLAAWLGGARVRVAHAENSYCRHRTAHRLMRPLFDRFYTDAYACGDEAGKWLYRGRAFRVARIAVDTQNYAFDPAARARFRHELGVGDALLVGSVANFTQAKNHGFLLDLFSDYLKINPDAKLALVGGGAGRADAEKRIAHLGIEGSVLVLGVRADVPELLSAFDVMLLPSLWEGFPNVLVEWQCAGLPALVSDTVTREAKLTPLISYLPIGSTAPWIESLARFAPAADRERAGADAARAVRDAGYDIRENARAMQTFYEEAAGRLRDSGK